MATSRAGFELTESTHTLASKKKKKESTQTHEHLFAAPVSLNYPENQLTDVTENARLGAAG
jgi:hypothetical protein